MNAPLANSLPRTLTFLLAIFLLAGAAACSGKSQKADRAPTERRVIQTSAPAPTAEVLKDSPCGNPDWAKPPGATGAEPADADFRVTSRTKPEDSDDETPSENPE